MSAKGTTAFEGTWGPVGVLRFMVCGAVLALANLLVVVAVMARTNLPVTASLGAALRGHSALEVAFLSAIALVAWYASCSRSSRSRCSIASTHSTIVEVDVERPLYSMSQSQMICGMALTICRRSVYSSIVMKMCVDRVCSSRT